MLFENTNLVGIYENKESLKENFINYFYNYFIFLEKIEESKEEFIKNSKKEIETFLGEGGLIWKDVIINYIYFKNGNNIFNREDKKLTIEIGKTYDFKNKKTEKKIVKKINIKSPIDNIIVKKEKENEKIEDKILYKDIKNIEYKVIPTQRKKSNLELVNKSKIFLKENIDLNEELEKKVEYI